MEILTRSSPNFDERTRPIDMLILHYTGMPTGEEAMLRMCDATSKVSAHYTVDLDGLIFRHVEEDKRAWHAGVSCWKGDTDINDRSIGIEIVNPGHEFGYQRFPAPQIEKVIALTETIASRYRIPPANVLGHSDVAPARKQDPGEWFPWKRLSEHGVGLWADAPESGTSLIGEHSSVSAVRELQELLAKFGYCLDIDGEYSEEMRQVVTAFQRHYNPGDIGTADEGYADGQTITVLEQLLQST